VEVNSLYSLHNAVSVRDEMGGILKGGNHLWDKISGSHSGEYEDDCLLRCCAM
jgi:hypothetical protein